MTESKKYILIADDMEINRGLLSMIFEEQFEILEAANGEETIRQIKEHEEHIAMLFLDLVMPGKDGLDVLKYMRLHNLMEVIPVIMVTGESTAETDTKAYEYGASDIIYKPFNSRVIMQRTLNIIELFETRRNLEQKLEERTHELQKTQEIIAKNNDFLINALSSVVEFRSLESSQHIWRVKYFTRILLNTLKMKYPEYNLTPEQIQQIVNASALHDLGKIAIPDNILLKPGKLTSDEFEIMKTHTTSGCELLERFKQDDNEFYQYCYEICRWHHERYDGKGYPDGLLGEKIPIWAQVVSIVDVWDALISKRVYKTAFAPQEAIRMIHDGECGKFSDVILDCFDYASDVLIESAEHLNYSDSDPLENSHKIKV